MKKSRFSANQILAALKQAKNGILVPELCRELQCHDLQRALQFWCNRCIFSGFTKGAEDENQCPKKIYTEEHLKAEILR